VAEVRGKFHFVMNCCQTALPCFLRQSLSQLYRKEFVAESGWGSFKSKSQIVVHSDDNLLLRAQVTLRRLNRGVAEEKFDLLQVVAILSA